MSSQNISNEIREKREALGITTKEFADALGLNKNGEKLLREWEKGTAVPAEDIYQKITSFASSKPFCKPVNEADFRFIDLVAGIGGIRIPFQELGAVFPVRQPVLRLLPCQRYPQDASVLRRFYPRIRERERWCWRI